MENPAEKSPERIPTKAEVMEIIVRHVESTKEFVTLREIHDEKGLCLLDLRIEATKPGETHEYLYTRAGVLPNGSTTLQTSIEVFLLSGWRDY